MTVVGDGAVGKTCMIICYTKDGFPTSYDPTVFDVHEAITKFEDDKMNINAEVKLRIHDTAGQAEL